MRKAVCEKEGSFQYIDDYVKKFVASKTGLSVRLDLQTGWVGVRPQEANGSVALAMFWAKVLQHRDNYPTDRVHYHRSRNSQTGVESLVIRVEDVTICLNLSSGQMEISGPQALLWLKKRFLALLRSYDGFKDTRDWYDDEADDGDRSLGRLGSAIEYAEIKQSDALLDDVWLGQTLDSRLERCKTPTVQPTSDFVRPLIKSLLVRWLSDEHTQVCLVTTELDPEMLRELCSLACRFKSTASFSFLCSPFKADPSAGKDLPSVRLAALQRLPSQDQMWLEYKLLRQFTSPLTASGVNLVAGLRLGQAQALLTSAPFHSAVQNSRSRADMVQFLQMSESIFLHDFVQPLNFNSGP